MGVLRPPVRSEGIAVRDLAAEPLVLVAPVGHWSQAAGAVRFEQLRREDFIMYQASLRSVVNDAVVRGCLAAGFYPHCAHEVAETSTALALVAAGLGVAVLPDSVRSAPREGLECTVIEDSVSVPVALAWRENDASPLLRRLLDVLESSGVFVGDDPA